MLDEKISSVIDPLIVDNDLQDFDIEESKIVIAQFINDLDHLFDAVVVLAISLIFLNSRLLNHLFQIHHVVLNFKLLLVLFLILLFFFGKEFLILQHVIQLIL